MELVVRCRTGQHVVAAERVELHPAEQDRFGGVRVGARGAGVDEAVEIGGIVLPGRGQSVAERRRRHRRPTCRDRSTDRGHRGDQRLHIAAGERLFGGDDPTCLVGGTAEPVLDQRRRPAPKRGDLKVGTDLAQPQLVRSDRLVEDVVEPAAGDDAVRTAALAQHERVVAGAAVERVVARAAIEQVIARAAVEPSLERSGDREGVDVVAVAAQQHVVAAATEQTVLPAAAD